MSKNNPNYLQLKKDNTFIFEYRSFHLYQHSTGVWKKIDKNQIILNSEIKYTSIPIFVSNDRTNRKSNSVDIDLNIIGNHGLADYECAIYINDTTYCIKRCDSLSRIFSTESPINNIYFKFFRKPKTPTTTAIPLPLITDIYSPKVKGGNELKIKITFKDVYFYYRPFINDTLKVRSNIAKLYDITNRKWEKMSKVPDADNVFMRYKDTSSVLNTFE